MFIYLFTHWKIYNEDTIKIINRQCIILHNNPIWSKIAFLATFEVKNNNVQSGAVWKIKFYLSALETTHI